MITMTNGCTVKSISNGMLRVHRLGCWWIGDFWRVEDAYQKIALVNSSESSGIARGIYDGGVSASEEEHDLILSKWA